MEALANLLPLILTVSLTILTIVLVAVGIQVFIVLRTVRKTVDRVNDAIDTAEMKIAGAVAPFQSLGNMTASLGVGLKVFESFVGWLNRSKRDE